MTLMSSGRAVPTAVRPTDAAPVRRQPVGQFRRLAPRPALSHLGLPAWYAVSDQADRETAPVPSRRALMGTVGVASQLQRPRPRW